MRDVEREIAPGVRGGDRNRAALFKTELKQTDNAAAAPAKRCDQLFRSNLMAIDTSWRRDAVGRSQRLDPHTSRIVDVARDHSNSSTWRARNRRTP